MIECRFQSEENEPIKQPVQASKSKNFFRLDGGQYGLLFLQRQANHPWDLVIARIITDSANNMEKTQALIKITANAPLLSIDMGESSYPLNIKQWRQISQNLYSLRGETQLGQGNIYAYWKIELQFKWQGDHALIELTGALDLPHSLPADTTCRMRIPICFPDPLPAYLEVAQQRGDNAAVAWDIISRSAISFVPPIKSKPGEIWDKKNEFVAEFQLEAHSNRFDASLCFAVASIGPEVNEILLEHYAHTRPMLLPISKSTNIPTHDSAVDAASALTAQRSISIRSLEKAYFTPPHRVGIPTSIQEYYYSGYPYFSVGASLSLIDWKRLTGEEAAARIGKMTARGIATDFPTNIVTNPDEKNKGAFWDRLVVENSGKAKTLSGYDGENAFSIVSNARAAVALFRIFSQCREEIFITMALGISRWLLLRQNPAGYFGGDRYWGDGKWSGGASLAGVEVIPAFVEAYRITKNEVYMRAARRVANYVTNEILPHHPAPSVIPIKQDGVNTDSPLGLSAIIRAFRYLDSEGPNKELRDAIHKTGLRLKCFPFDRRMDAELNYDGQWGGVYECAMGAFWIYALERNPAQLKLGLSLLKSIPPDDRKAWRAIPAYTASMLATACQIEQLEADLIDSNLKNGWRKFEPDPATCQYIHVESTRTQTPIDHLSLVCKKDDATLLIVSSDKPVSGIKIIKNNRIPTVRDLSTNELLAGEIQLHNFDFDWSGQFGAFIIPR